MHPERRTRLSRFLSLVLRHRPEEVGLAVDEEGRIPLVTLLPALHARGWENLSADDVAELVRMDGRRFALESGMIRARYGHSITLARPGPEVRPPEWLYIAIPVEALDGVRQDGVQPLERRHIHLCVTPRDARKVLERNDLSGGLITILARRAHDQGVPFYQATDRLYLTAQIPSRFLYMPAPALDPTG